MDGLIFTWETTDWSDSIDESGFMAKWLKYPLTWYLCTDGKFYSALNVRQNHRRIFTCTTLSEVAELAANALKEEGK